MKKLRSLMVTNVETLQHDATLREAANKMKRSEVGALPVCSDGEVIGIVTDRDLVVRGLAAGLDPARTRVSQIMTDDIVTGDENLDIKSAARLMEQKGVGRLLILDKNEQLKGILSLGSLTHYLGKDRLAGVVEERLPGRRFSFGRALLGTVALGAGFFFMNRNQDRRVPIHREAA